MEKTSYFGAARCARKKTHFGAPRYAHPNQPNLQCHTARDQNTKFHNNMLGTIFCYACKAHNFKALCINTLFRSSALHAKRIPILLWAIQQFLCKTSSSATVFSLTKLNWNLSVVCVGALESYQLSNLNEGLMRKRLIIIKN